MKLYSVEFSPEADAQLASIYAYIAVEADHATAKGFVDGIVTKCRKLDTFPHRNTPRFDLRPRLRTFPYRRAATIAYKVDDESLMVSIVGVFYRGQDFEQRLRDE